jgi:hypothetical protein
MNAWNMKTEHASSVLDFLPELLAPITASWHTETELVYIALAAFIKTRAFRELIHSYFGLKLPNVKVAVTGSGRVAHGVLEIMNLIGLHEVEPDEFLAREFPYPVYVQLKGADLYGHHSMAVITAWIFIFIRETIVANSVLILNRPIYL